MSVRNLATLDRTVFQPLGRILQEAFADGFIGTGNVTIAKTFSGATVQRLFDCLVTYSSTGAPQYGAYRFYTLVDGALSAPAHGIATELRFGASSSIPATYADGTAAMRIKLAVNGTPNFVGKGISAITFQNFLVETGGPPEFLYPFWFHCGAGCQFDGLFYCDASGLGIVACEGDHTILSEDKLVPCKIDGDTYYLLALKSIPNQ